MEAKDRARLLYERQRCAECRHFRMYHIPGLGRVDCIGSMPCECDRFRYDGDDDVAAHREAVLTRLTPRRRLEP